MAKRIGPRWLNQVTQIAGNSYSARLSRYALLAEKVNKLEREIEILSDHDLKQRSYALRMKGRQGDALSTLLVEAFAIVREAASRTIKQRHFDVQLIGGAAIFNRSIAEMETGEGKTLTATLPTYLNALAGKGIHVVTVNDYLAKRDADWMGEIYRFLGMTVGCIQTGQPDEARRKAYNCDITYGTSKEFGFDFLRDELKRYQLGGDGKHKTYEQVYLGHGESPASAMPVQRGHHYCVVDEADSILIDEARTPLIIGANNQPSPEEAQAYYGADEVAATLVRGKDFKYDPAERKAELNAVGRRKVQMKAGKSAFGCLTVDQLYEYVERALRGQIAYLRDREYAIQDGEIVIVDEFTGRLMPGRQWQDGLHQAIQAKERLEITLESITAARITVQDYFKRYKKLAGMTGTAWSDRNEIAKTYKVRVFPVPTNRSSRRLWDKDRIFSTESEKFRAVADRIIELNKQEVPVLVGTRSIEKSEKLSALLQEAGIPHQILNAKHHAVEAEIVSKAGQLGKVTVATNMAGRGTDIKILADMAAKGGLHVIGTERHESLRIDRQLAGRCARQGDPGHAQFFVCCEDDLLEVFGEKWAHRLRGRYKNRGELTSAAWRKLFLNAQKKKERQHRRDRRLLMHYEKHRADMRKNMGLNPVLG